MEAQPQGAPLPQGAAQPGVPVGAQPAAEVPAEADILRALDEAHAAAQQAAVSGVLFSSDCALQL